MAEKKPTADANDNKPADRAGFTLCDVCGGVLYAADAPRHSTHTRAEVTAAHKERREAANDPEAEAAEQSS